MSARRERGRVSVSQIVMLAALVAGLYFGVMYLPILSHRWAMGDIARKAAAKMIYEFNDMEIREFVRTEAEQHTGIQIGTSELWLERRRQPTQYVVTIRWTEQVKHLWGKNHVMKMAVTEGVEPGGTVIKNAQ